MNANELLKLAIASGNVSAPMQVEGELMEAEAVEMDNFAGFSASTREAQEKHALALKQLETKHRQRIIDVPTNEEEVKQMLRAYGQPICLFGERNLDRRERLKRTIAEIQVNVEAAGGSFSLPAAVPAFASTKTTTQYARNKRAFFTEASKELIEARERIAAVSWKRARERLARERAEEDSEEEQRTYNAMQIATLNEPRPISACAFSRQTGDLVTGSFDHNVRVYDAERFTLKHTLLGHENRVCDAKFAQAPNVVCSGSAEGQIRVWKLLAEQDGGNSTSSILAGHVSRVGKLACFGNFLVSTSFDQTFRLWDLEAEKCLLLQDGHSREVYACAVHPDESLLCTTDLGGIGRVWDLRCAQTTHTLVGHTLGVLSCDFAPNGALLATASLDNTVRVWDLRKSSCANVLPCHFQAVTSCRFDAQSLRICTASHDRSLAMWDIATGRRLAHMSKLHEGPILGMDLLRPSSSRAQLLAATVGYDRSVKFVEF